MCKQYKDGDYIELGQLGAYGLTLEQIQWFYSNEIFELNDKPIMSLYSSKVDYFCNDKKNGPNIGHNKKSFLNNPVEHKHNFF